MGDGVPDTGVSRRFRNRDRLSGCSEQAARLAPVIVQSKQPDAAEDVVAAAAQQPAKQNGQGKMPMPKEQEKSREPYRIQTWDILGIRVQNTFPDEPIAGPYAVDPEGKINLGTSYGPPILIVDLTLDEAKRKIEEQLRRGLKDPHVELTLVLGQTKAIERELDLARTARELVSKSYW